MKIRRATLDDAKRISYLICKLTEPNPNNYSKKQKIAWKKFNSPSGIKKQIKKRIVFCAFENNRLLGTIALKDNGVVGFNVGFNIRGKGVGSKMLNYLESLARKKGMKKLTLTSTTSAFDFYKKRGFKPKKKVVLRIYGVDFPEIHMEKIV